ncbi:carboxypeptidase-like regulatory domain-containing protein [Antarcticibacterium sp. 1MA-6-2]|uniref:carboxypeptidase-like regulatory domain-containing protein n=1 Tax=Antarcticibacterium sp. 1MA-6-2 TaxID=2908210 RepID=UPI001F48B46F|nr:carboxypeptidase-like regulatory domain-containing protein [Antarcticibacterium sp. 1MA-6-2]UJH90183.1 carboxypeptidase-like regulatory domain-containing protein [Antarcticibacterium sp. 1MA-6-2]
MKKKLLLFFACLGLPIIALAQQDILITGTVLDLETGIPIPSANVIEKGTSNGVLTDFDGKFTIEVPPGAVLEISYLGYATREIKIEGEAELQIEMEPSHLWSGRSSYRWLRNSEKTKCGRVSINY